MRYGGHFFDAGRIRAQIRAADARDAAGLARYEQTVLQALAETETALSRLRREKEGVERLEASVGSNRDAVHLAELRYRGGLKPFLPVLDAERALFESETELVTSETALGTDVVALYEALGGGWEHTGS